MQQSNHDIWPALDTRELRCVSRGSRQTTTENGKAVGDCVTTITITTTGRVEKEKLFDSGTKYMLFSHNKKIGSVKDAVSLAEMLYKKGKFI